MATILIHSNGNYYQKITINSGCGNNHVLVKVNSKEVYNDDAKNIRDIGNMLQFQDMNGKEYSFVKYKCYTTI